VISLGEIITPGKKT